MELLYIGFAVKRQLESQLRGISVAGNKMQINLLCELSKAVEKLNVVSIYPCAAYPSDLIINVKKQTIDVCDSLDIHKQKCTIQAIVPYMVNLPIIKNVFEMVSTFRAAKCIIIKNRITKVLIFNAFPSTAYAALKLKRKYGCEVICLLADLPIDDSVKTKGIMKLLRYAMDNYTRYAIQQMDKLVVLNEEAAKLYAPKVPYIIVEGAVNTEEIPIFNFLNPKRKNIVFTGSLQKHNGIVEIVEAVKLLKDTNVELDIYGRGEYENYVEQASKEYPSIHYCGLKSNQEILEIQKYAYLLVNPRPVDNYISQVTFPSKIFEYMTSGTPVLTTKLNGFGPEYMNTMFFVENNSPGELATAIKKILDLPIESLCLKAEAAYNLVIQEKNWALQVNRIIKFIKQ